MTETLKMSAHLQGCNVAVSLKVTIKLLGRSIFYIHNNNYLIKIWIKKMYTTNHKSKSV